MGQAAPSASTIDRLYPGVTPAALKFPNPDKRLAYGTAGFRDAAELLESTLLRMGMLAALRSMKTGMASGIVVTASHNAAGDNGVKLVDPGGGMLERAWEGAAEELANAPPHRLAFVIAAIAAREGILLPLSEQTTCKMPPFFGRLNGGGEGDAAQGARGPEVLIARDTRASGPHLQALAEEGVALLGGAARDLGELTTPQLHHCVRMANAERGGGPYWGRAEWRGEGGYFKMVASAFAELADAVDDATLARRNSRGWFGIGGGGSEAGPTTLYVDAANGVGAKKVAMLRDAVAACEGQLDCEVRNDGTDGELNLNCGAEHAQKTQRPPAGFVAGRDNGKRCCSLDGDADRLVYHYFDSSGVWHLLDGDKMAALVATFLQEELAAAGLHHRLSMAVVQTAYANGASTAFLKANGIKVAFAATGVKFLHHEALRYDVGVYFEANGHGTVLFKDSTVSTLLSRQHELQGVEAAAEAAAVAASKQGGRQRARRGSEVERQAAAAQQVRRRKALAVKRLLHVRQLVNQAVGDAFSDILLAEAILRLRKWGLPEWDAMYADLPSRQAKLRVADRSVVRCTADETRALAPPNLQARLNAEAHALDPRGRCFVRPSGTEDAVRVYAEAATQGEADALALAALQAVYDLAGGVGERPTTAVPPSS